MRRLALVVGGLLCAGPGVAQTAEALDLRVPEPALYAPAEAAVSRDPPGTYYGDRSGPPVRHESPVGVAGDDGKARVSGSVTTGIGHSKGYGTSHYNAAELNVSKSFGEGEQPNQMNLHIRVEKSDGPGFGDRMPYPYSGPDAFYPAPYPSRFPPLR